MSPAFDPKATTFALADIGRAIGYDSDTLRKWFDDGEAGGGLQLFPELGDVPGASGRSHQLHWRTALVLMIAVKLNEFGIRKRGGDAATLAANAFKAGLGFEHLHGEARPLILIQPGGDGAFYVELVARTAVAGYVENVPEPIAFGAVGSILLDPASFGAILAELAREAA